MTRRTAQAVPSLTVHCAVCRSQAGHHFAIGKIFWILLRLLMVMPIVMLCTVFREYTRAVFMKNMQVTHKVSAACSSQ